MTAAGGGAEKKCLNSELWHACAGPLVSLPTPGTRVVYFPQGHSDQVAATTNKQVDAHIPNYPSLPPQLICQLHNVTMHVGSLCLCEFWFSYITLTCLFLLEERKKKLNFGTQMELIKHWISGRCGDRWSICPNDITAFDASKLFFSFSSWSFFGLIFWSFSLT